MSAWCSRTSCCSRTRRWRRTSSFRCACSACPRRGATSGWPGSMRPAAAARAWRRAIPNELSGGQQQRVALARGLISRPALLLLDEPLANLDRELRSEMEVEIRRYQKELGIPFIYVTHNQEEALTMSDRIAVMRNGRFEQIGAKTEIYTNPATRLRRDLRGPCQPPRRRGSRRSTARWRAWRGTAQALLVPRPPALAWATRCATSSSTRTWRSCPRR